MRPCLFILVCLTLLLAAESVFAQTEGKNFIPVYANVVKDKVNIRAGCGLNFEVLGQLNKTTKVVVLGNAYGWCKIKLPKEASCFVHSKYIERGIVKAAKLRVRAAADCNANVIGSLRKGDLVVVLGQAGEWLKIAPPEGSSGWVKEDYLSLSKKRFIHNSNISNPPLINNSKGKVEKIEVCGTIDDLGKIFNRQGTHKLILNKEILYYLKSEKIDLNLYPCQTVCVRGRIIEAEGAQYQVINVEEIEVKRCY